MTSIDYRELSPANRHMRLQRIRALKAMIAANGYDVGAREIADVIIADTQLSEEKAARRPGRSR